MQKVSQTIKVELLDFAPKFDNIGPDKIVAASGILTMKNKDKSFKETIEGIDDKVLKGFHKEATRRGHASLTTSVNFYFWLEGSRMLDFYFTSFPFGSYMMFSSRRIELGLENMVMPDAVAESEFKSEYETICKKMVDLYQAVKQLTGSIDYARRILPLGFMSRGLFNLPLQLVLGVIKEARDDSKSANPCLPKEIGEFARQLEDCIRSNTSYLADAALKLSYNTNFTHPNLFKSDVEFRPGEKARILLKDEALGKILNELKDKLEANASISDSKKQIEKNAEVWREFVEKVQNKILIEANVVGSLSIWPDIKRHRTVRQKVESVYSAVDRCLEKLEKLDGKGGKSFEGNSYFEDNFYMPPLDDADLRKKILAAYKEALEFYKKMVDSGIEKRDAVYIIPHGINLALNMFLDGYHIFDPFGFIGLRACTMTDHEIVAMVNKMIGELRKEIPELESMLGPKCKIGYCPEKSFCGLVKQFVKDYDENLHASFQ